jgi:energy-coupling factor transporter transmembrane protein EcfT
VIVAVAVAMLMIMFMAVIGFVAVFVLMLVAVLCGVVVGMPMCVVMMMIMSAMLVMLMVVPTAWPMDMALWRVFGSQQDCRFVFQRGVLLGIKLVHAGQYPKAHGFQFAGGHIGPSLSPGKFYEVVADLDRNSPLG